MTKNIRNIKIALIGDSGVGKSSIALRFTNNEFDSNYISTGGAAYSNKIIKKFGETLQLDIWDTAGQERYRSLGKSFYKDAFIVLLVYDITRQESFDNLKNIWYVELERNGEEKPIIAIVGNKIDQYEKENTVNEEEAKKYAGSVNAIFKVVSAKNGDNINDLFNSCLDAYYNLNYPDKVKNIIERRASQRLIPHNNNDGKNNNNKDSNKVKKKKCC